MWLEYALQSWVLYDFLCFWQIDAEQLSRVLCSHNKKKSVWNIFWLLIWVPSSAGSSEGRASVCNHGRYWVCKWSEPANYSCAFPTEDYQELIEDIVRDGRLYASENHQEILKVLNMLVLIGNYIIWCEFVSCYASGLFLGAPGMCCFRKMGWISRSWLCRAVDRGSFAQGDWGWLRTTREINLLGKHLDTLLLVACRLAKAFPPWEKEISLWISLILFRELP